MGYRNGTQCKRLCCCLRARATTKSATRMDDRFPKHNRSKPFGHDRQSSTCLPKSGKSKGMQAIQFNSHGRGTNSPVEHYTGGHGTSFCLEDQKPQPPEPPSPRWGFSFLGTSGRDLGEQFCTDGYCQEVQPRMSGHGRVLMSEADHWQRQNPNQPAPSQRISPMREHDQSRKFADKSVAIANETLEKGKAALEQSTQAIEQSYSAMVGRMRDYNLKMMDKAQANTVGSLRVCSPTLDREVIVRSCRTVDGTLQKANRDAHRTDQRAGCAWTEIRCRKRRADHAKLQPGFQERLLSLELPT